LKNSLKVPTPYRFDNSSSLSIVIVLWIIFPNFLPWVEYIKN